MKNNVLFIKFFSIASVITLVVSYLINRWAFQTRWIDSGFLFSIFSGIFASFIVVLITEIKKYFVNKHLTEDSIYANCVGLYTELTAQIKALDMYLKSPAEVLPGALLEHRMPILASFNNALRFIDYTTLKKDNPITKQFFDFVHSRCPEIDQHIILCGNLQIAVTQTQLNKLKQGNFGYLPTAQDPLVLTAAEKIMASAEMQRTEVKKFLQAMVRQYPNRFNWKKEEESINNVNLDLSEMHKKQEAFFSPSPSNQ